jgi:hypothetical protein
MTASRTHSLKHKPPASLPPSQWKSARTTNAIEQLHDRFNRRIKSHFHMESLEFLTSEQVSERLQGVSTVLEDNDRVGFVTLTGTFVFSAPKNSNPATFESAYAVFRAEVAAQRALGQIDDLLVYFDEVYPQPLAWRKGSDRLWLKDFGWSESARRYLALPRPSATGSRDIWRHDG